MDTPAVEEALLDVPAVGEALLDVPAVGEALLDVPTVGEGEALLAVPMGEVDEVTGNVPPFRLVGARTIIASHRASAGGLLIIQSSMIQVRSLNILAGGETSQSG